MIPPMAEAGGRLPNFLILGAAKSGTTSLSSYLTEHPDVFVAIQKEVDFFDDETNWQRGPEWYREQFAGATTETAVGEATPSYLFDPALPERIFDLMPDAKLIVTLREPASRAYSHYMHWVSLQAADPRPFSQAIADELAGDPDGSGVLAPGVHGYVARGIYLPQLERYVAKFGRDRLHVILLDDISSDPVGVWEDLCRFLGVDPAFRPESLGSVQNAHHTFRPQWLYRFMVRHGLYEKLGRRLGTFFVFRVTKMRFEQPPPADPATMQRLREFYAPHVAALGDWLGRDLSRWSPPAQP